MKRASQLLLILLSTTLLISTSCNDATVHKRKPATHDQMLQDTARINRVLDAAGNAESPSDSLMAELDTISILCRNYGMDSCLAEAIFRKGNQLYMKNMFSEALEAYTTASGLADEQHLITVKAHCLERMASVHLGTDNRPLAISLYYQSLGLSELAGDSIGIARVYNILAIYKAEEGEFDTAVNFLNKALGINNRLNDRRNAIENEGNLGYVYESSGNLEKAAEIYHSLVKELSSQHDVLSLPVIYYNLASLHQRKHDNDSALAYLRKAIGISAANSDTSMLTVLYGNTGEILMNINRQDSARFCLLKSVYFSQAIDDVETELQAMKFLVKLDTMSGKYRSAIQWNQRIQLLKDSVYQRQLRNNSKEAELRYENEKKKGLIAAQNLEIKSADREKNLYLLILILSLGAFSLLVIVLFDQRKNHRKNKLLMEEQLLVHNLQIEKLRQDEELKQFRLQKVELELRQKQSEQMSTVLALDQKKELLNQIFDKVKSVSSGNGTLSVNDLNSILTSIKLQLNEPPDSDMFNRLLSEVHEDFFVRLKERHPELTPSEVKFCAYLKARLSNNQIASILNVTQHAVKKARYRIRKKMKLESDESLEDCILDL